MTAKGFSTHIDIASQRPSTTLRSSMVRTLGGGGGRALHILKYMVDCCSSAGDLVSPMSNTIDCAKVAYSIKNGFIPGPAFIVALLPAQSERAADSYNEQPRLESS